MNPTDEELRKAVALFRYGLIADVLRVGTGHSALQIAEPDRRWRE